MFPVALEMTQLEASATEKLGEVNFPVSCTADARHQFNRAVALLHSFWYDEAVKAFTAVGQTDPNCSMAYWGIAMSLWHSLWEAPDEPTLRRGREAVEKAKTLGPKTNRERDFINAIDAYYGEGGKRDNRTRAIAYEKEMEKLHLRYPDDQEAAVFYALSLDATAMPSDKTFSHQRKAGKILEKVFAANPLHPGAAHYIIHSYDYPPLASMALEAARKYAQIAPSSPHALHMPSHIFTRLGLWHESIESNRASSAASKAYVAKTDPGAAYFEDLHALDYLMYAYLQGAQDNEARKVLGQVTGFERAQPENFAAAYAFTAIPARYTLEQGRWADAALLALHPASFPWDRFRFAEANLIFARAVGAARSNNVPLARREVEALQSIQAALSEAKLTYWADQVDIQRTAAAAWLLHAEGKNDDALSMMRSAAHLEDSTDKHPVTPGYILPSRELLGDMLMELNRPADALAEYEASLGSQPNRFRSLYGAAHAAELSGDRNKAATYFSSLIKVSEQGDAERPEIRKAKEYLIAR